jgi:hypothetical protein
MIDAWDPGGALGTLFIPVDNFPSLGNGGDTIAIWDNMADYAVDAASSMPARTTEHAAAVLAYDDVAPWPVNNNAGSIFLVNLASPTVDGGNWLRSAVGDFVGSKNAAAVTEDVAIHPGGDIGSPGAFDDVSPSFAAADFNHSGVVDAVDLATWKAAFKSTAGGDADADGDSDGADFLIWQRQHHAANASAATAAVPESKAFVLVAAGLIAFTIFRRFDF